MNKKYYFLFGLFQNYSPMSSVQREEVNRPFEDQDENEADEQDSLKDQVLSNLWPRAKLDLLKYTREAPSSKSMYPPSIFPL